MALNIKSNRLIPILAGGVALIVVLIALRSGEPRAPASKPMTAVPKSEVQADADSPSDTLRTLATDVRESRKQMAKLSQENQELKDRNAELARDRTAMEDAVTKRLADQFAKPESANSPVLSGVSSRIDSLEARLATFSAGTAPAGTATGQAGAGAAGDIPGGLGYDGGGLPRAATSNAIVWTEPMGRVAPKGAAAGAANAQQVNLAYGDPLDSLPPTAAGIPSSQKTGATPRANGRNELEPWFTIPENATLIGSTSMTALVGRVPIDGKVTDPVPFKALIGRDNLAANGLMVPEEITGMVVSGKAVGDWTLECAYGDVESVTFLFEDGTIRTVSNRTGAGKDNDLGGQANSTAGSNARIAWISDERGLPCLSGRKITNAPAYLTGVIGLKTMQTAAEAVAASQITQQATPLGGTQSFVTGETGKYVAGKAVAGGVDEVAQWVQARMRNSFDAIYVPAGKPLALHLDRAIHIDRGPDSRQLDYRRKNGATRTTTTASLD